MDDINGWNRESASAAHEGKGWVVVGKADPAAGHEWGMPISMRMYGLCECRCGQTKRAMRVVTPHLFSIAVPSS